MTFIRDFPAAIAAAALAIAPAAAQDNAGFTGARVEVGAGYDNITRSTDANDVVYVGAIGVDAPLGDKFTVGVEANANNVFERTRQIGAAARVGYAFDLNTLGYVKAGYANYQDVASRSLDGFTVGAGVEQKVSSRTFVKAEYRYSDFNRDTGSHAVFAGVGLRF